MAGKVFVSACRHNHMRIISGSRSFHISSARNNNNNNNNNGETGTLIPKPEVTRFIRDCMVSVGTPVNHAEELADNLIAADYRGHFSHGLNRLDLYVKDVSSKVCDGHAVPSIVKETVATALVDGNNGLGAVVGNYSMALAMKKAKDVGIGWVAARNSNHYGIAGYYSLQAMEAKLIGMSFTNTSPFMVPTRGKVPCLGTNPITVAAAGSGSDQFVLDMATTAVAVGKIELQKRKGEPIPAGWAQDKTGKVTTDATVGVEAGCLLPLGGTELNSGYKGYGLGLMVELFCGVLAGATYGPNIRKWMTTETPANLGQCFVAIDPACFADGFAERLSDLMTSIKKSPPVDPSKPILVAGDPELQHMAKVDASGGIQYHINQINASKNMAKTLNVKEMQAIG